MMEGAAQTRALDGDCDVGERCRNGVCIDENNGCVDNFDCPSGQFSDLEQAAASTMVDRRSQNVVAMPTAPQTIDATLVVSVNDSQILDPFVSLIRTAHSATSAIILTSVFHSMPMLTFANN